jgi:hypothetical protein
VRENEDDMSKKTTLSACVSRMKALSLKGKLRDDAANHFFAGVVAADPSMLALAGEVSEGGYLAVLEALADVGADEDAAAEFAEV